MKDRIEMYDGHVSTRIRVGHQVGVYLLSTNVRGGENRPRAGVRLIGFGPNEREAAKDLVAQLRLYADWIAYAHGLPVLDLDTLNDQVKRRTALSLEMLYRYGR